MSHEMMRESTSTSLLLRAQDQDPEAWHRLVALYGPLVYRWCRRWGVSADDAPDVAQEVFCRVAGAIADFRHDQGGSFRGWLWTIAKHETCDHLTRRRRQAVAEGGTLDEIRLQQTPEELPDDEPPEPDESIRLLCRALELICGDFQSRTWQIFQRTAIEGRDAADVAEELGMTARAVRQAKHRVLKRLREEYDGLLVTFEGESEED